MRIEFVLDTEPHRRPIHAGTMRICFRPPTTASPLSAQRPFHLATGPRSKIAGAHPWSCRRSKSAKTERALSEIPAFPVLRPVRDKRWSWSRQQSLRLSLWLRHQENSGHRPQRRIPECRHLSLRLGIETVRPTAPEGTTRGWLAKLVLWRGNAYNAESFGFILTANFTFACHSVDWPLKECMHKK